MRISPGIERSWNSLLLRLARSRQPLEALLAYDEMQENHPSLHAYSATLAALVKACGELRDAALGLDLHARISRNGALQRSDSLPLGNALVRMFSKCGSFGKAQEVFETLLVRDVVSWTALIAGIDAARNNDAMSFFECMRFEGLAPNEATFVCILKACSSSRSVEHGREMHIDIDKRGFLEGDVVGNALVDMYAKCGSFTDAENLFEKLLVRDKVSWTSLIVGYAGLEQEGKALQRFEQMQVEGVSLDAVAFLCTLKACRHSIGAGNIRKRLHSVIAFNGLLDSEPVLGNMLVDSYGESGQVVEAQKVFCMIPCQDLISWNALISGYAKQEIIDETHNGLQQMQQEGILPDAITFVCCLKSCGCARAVAKGKYIHARIGNLEWGIAIGNALVDMYAKCGLFTEAQEVFDNLLDRNVVSWTVMMVGYTNHGHAEDALALYMQMQSEGVCPNSITYICCLRACGILQDLVTGQQIHAEMNKKGSSESNDLVLGNALLSMYAKCGLFSEALDLHDKLCVRDVASWNALLTGYALHKKARQAVDFLKHMQVEGLSPDSITLTSVLKACGNAEAVKEGRNIHDEIAKKGLFRGDLVIGNALIDMHMKCGLLHKAQEVFNMLSIRDAVSWTTLISGYTKEEHGEEAVRCYESMLLDGILPDAISYACVLKACGIIGAVHKGVEVHADIARCKMLDKDLDVGNSLIEMYVRCGCLVKAEEVFDMLPLQNSLSWTLLIGGYVERQETGYVFHMLERMRGEGKIPDEATFVTILTACNQGCQVDDGELYFQAMIDMYDIDPTLEHCSCIVDLLCRAGLLERAVTVIEEMPVSPDPILWYIIMDACRKWGNVDLGKTAFKHALVLDKRDPSLYACMCNIYADNQHGAG